MARYIRIDADRIFELPATELKVYAALISHGNNICRRGLSQKQIARTAQLSLRTTNTALALLVGRGVIRRYTPVSGNRHKRTRYTLPTGSLGNYALIPASAFSLTAAAFKLLAYFVLCVDKQRRAFPSLHKCAALLGMSRNTVRRAAEELEVAGYTETEIRYYAKSRETNARRSNCYHVRKNAAFASIAKKCHPHRPSVNHEGQPPRVSDRPKDKTPHTGSSAVVGHSALNALLERAKKCLLGAKDRLRRIIRHFRS